MAVKYGAAAYPGKFPIGPSKEYESPLGISESKAHYHPEKLDDLLKALTENPGTGRLIWVPESVQITMPNAAFGKTIKSGFILAGKLSRIKWQYYGPQKGYMLPLFNVQTDAVVSGIVFEGAGGYGHYGQGAGPCGLRLSGQKRTLIENTDLSQFRGGGVWFGDGGATITRWDDDAQRNILRHVKIEHIQQYGFGYGVGLQGANQSFLIEASILGKNRHSTMTSGGTTSAYEVRYCIIDDSVYANSDTGPASIQSHQIDVHGGGWKNQGYKCGRFLYVHHNDFSSNDTFSPKPNVMIRGVMAGEAIIEWNWTRKYSKANPPDESLSNMLVQLAEEEGEPWAGPSKKLSLANVTCRNNWYGKEAPPDDGQTPDEGPVDVNTADIKVTGLEAPQVVVGEEYSVTATVENVGDAPGERAIEIGWITGNGTKIPLETKSVPLDPGESDTVVQKAKAVSVGDWSFYCDDLRVVLKVVDKPPAVPVFEMSGLAAVADSDSVSIVATVTNTGGADGQATVKCGDVAKTVDVAAGASQQVVFDLPVGLQNAG